MMKKVAFVTLLCIVAANAREICNFDVNKPICVEHYDTGCKPSWWGVPEFQNGRCMSLEGHKRVRQIMPNRCQYNKIKAMYCWEVWEEVDKKVNLSKRCQDQWKKFGFSADKDCQKC